MGVISASKAYGLAHDEGKRRLYQSIQNAAECGEMHYDTPCASLAQDTIEELKSNGYEVTPAGCYMRISWLNAAHAFNQ